MSCFILALCRCIICLHADGSERQPPAKGLLPPTFYIPADEEFSVEKNFTFQKNAVLDFLPSIVPKLAAKLQDATGCASIHRSPMRFGSTAKVLLKCKLKYYISECRPPCGCKHEMPAARHHLETGCCCRCGHLIAQHLMYSAAPRECGRETIMPFFCGGT